MANLVDPLESYSGLSLFAQTLPHNPPPSTADPLSIHSYLMSLPVRDPDKLLHQAKIILETASEGPNCTEMPPPEEAEKNDIVASPRGRRKGLERKRERPRFSLVPNSSNSNVNLELTLDFDKLKDPEELFLAFERLENAKREMAKQTGRVSLDFNQNAGSVMAPRPRRQGIPGRPRTAKYQHLYPAIASQGPIEDDNLSPENHGLQQEVVYPDIALQKKEVVSVASQQGEPAVVESEEMEMNGSILKAEGRVDKLLDELLAHDLKDLDGDGAVNLLQEHLRIKSLDISKLNLPELGGVQRADLKAPRVNAPKPRNVLSDIHNLLKGTKTETPLKHKKTGNSVGSLGSPNPMKSPFSSLSLLSKRLSQSDQSTDPFSAADIDQSPAGNTSPSENINKSSDSINKEKGLSISGKLKSIIIEHDDTAVCTVSTSKENLVDMATGGIHENSAHSDNDADLQTNRPNQLEDMVEKRHEEAMDSAQPDPEMLNNVYNQFDQSNAPVVEEYAMDGCSEIQENAPSQTQDTVPEQTEDTALEPHNEEVKESFAVSTNRKAEEKLCPRKSREVSRRQSLAASGSVWIDGKRRSTRRTFRPLEYWKGERLLYGRIHTSLATVIGVKKYKTPSKDEKDEGKRTIIVESYVSNKYNDLVSLAALH